VSLEAQEHAARAGTGDPKSVVRRMIDEVMNGGRLDVIDELYSPHMAPGARRWIAPLRESFPDVQMEIVDLIAEGEKVVGRLRCSATNLGPWRGQPPTGRRFERVDEVYIFRIRDGQISEAWGIEDTEFTPTPDEQACRSSLLLLDSVRPSRVPQLTWPLRRCGQ
jgi:predicted ester cyclase